MLQTRVVAVVDRGRGRRRGFHRPPIRGFFGSEGIIVTPKVFADDPESFDPKVVKYDTAHELMAANHRSAPDDLEDATPLSQFVSAQR